MYEVEYGVLKKMIKNFCKNRASGRIIFDAENFEYYYENNKNHGINPEVLVPISFCWLIENNCNLDCIYCFSDHKKIGIENNDYIETAKNILSLDPLTIVLTGGEPTLNKNLKEILDFIDGDALTIIDSNGTTDVWSELIPSLKNSIVRFSIDSLNENTINKVRPSSNRIFTSNQIPTITKNIRILSSNDILVTIQTVVTRYNINELDEIYNYLVQNGIKHWYLSVVKYSEKCSNIYSDIYPTDEEIKLIKHKIKTYNQKKIKVKLSIEKSDFDNSRVFIDKTGKFFVELVDKGITYIGANPTKPTISEICNELNLTTFYDLYINKKNIVNLDDISE